MNGIELSVLDKYCKYSHKFFIISIQPQPQNSSIHYGALSQFTRQNRRLCVDMTVILHLAICLKLCTVDFHFT